MPARIFPATKEGAAPASDALSVLSRSTKDKIDNVHIHQFSPSRQ